MLSLSCQRLNVAQELLPHSPQGLRAHVESRPTAGVSTLKRYRREAQRAPSTVAKARVTPQPKPDWQSGPAPK
eukprot:6932882-Pyramimonas_sp.AAC.1